MESVYHSVGYQDPASFAYGGQDDLLCQQDEHIHLHCGGGGASGTQGAQDLQQQHRAGVLPAASAGGRGRSGSFHDTGWYRDTPR